MDTKKNINGQPGGKVALFLFGITLQPFARQFIVEALLVNELTKAKMRKGKKE